MATRFERGLFDPDAPPGASPFDHTIWVIVSDGDLQEGVSAEVGSLAGHQRLGNLVVLYDDNHISIEGDTAAAFSEDVLARYAAYGWHTRRVEPKPDGDLDPAALYEALHGGQGGDLPPVRRRRPQHHRLAGADRAQHRQGARRGARRRRGRGDEEGARLRPGAQLRRRRRRPRARPRRRRPGPRRARALGRALRRVAGGQPGAGARLRPDRRGPAPRRLGAGDPGLPRRQGHGDPQGVRRGAGRARRGRPGAVGRLGGPGRIQQHDHRRGLVVPAHRATPCPAPTRTAAPSTGGSASTPWARP